MRFCLLEPIDEIFQAANRLQEAVDAHCSHDFERADRLIRLADCPAVRDWTERLWGRQSPDIHTFTASPDSPPHLSICDRPMPRMPNLATQSLVIQRDGFHCRFCGIPVILAQVRRAMHRAYPEALPWGRTTAAQHSAFQCMWMQFDHLLPNSRGGRSDLENVVITCAPCNFGRMEWTIDECGLDDPSSRTLFNHWAGFGRWRGLEEFLRTDLPHHRPA